MISLQDVIKATSSENIEVGESTIVIDKTKSKKRNRLSTNEKKLRNSEAIREDSFWKRKYEEMANMYKQAEEDLKVALSTKTVAENDLALYVSRLEDQLLLQEKQIQLLQGFNLNYSKCRPLQSDQKLKLFETMTGMVIDRTEKESITCTVNNLKQNRFVQFSLSCGKDNINEIHFRPMREVEILPKYLREEVDIEESVAPGVLGDILQSVFSD